MVRNGKFKNYLGGGTKKCVWVWGEPGRESQASIIPGGRGCHLRGQDADGELRFRYVGSGKHGALQAEISQSGAQGKAGGSDGTVTGPEVIIEAKWIHVTAPERECREGGEVQERIHEQLPCLWSSRVGSVDPKQRERTFRGDKTRGVWRQKTPGKKKGFQEEGVE